MQRLRLDAYIEPVGKIVRMYIPSNEIYEHQGSTKAILNGLPPDAILMEVGKKLCSSGVRYDLTMTYVRNAAEGRSMLTVSQNSDGKPMLRIRDHYHGRSADLPISDS